MELNTEFDPNQKLDKRLEISIICAISFLPHC